MKMAIVESGCVGKICHARVDLPDTFVLILPSFSSATELASGRSCCHPLASLFSFQNLLSAIQAALFARIVLLLYPLALR